MLVIFFTELEPSQYLTEERINELISSFPTMPTDAMKSIENLEMISFWMLKEMERGKGYGNINERRVYFAWEMPCPPSIGWMFSIPFSLGFDCLSTITNIHFGSGDTLLCEYE